MIEIQDVIVLMLIVLLLFAPSRLPLLARSLRRSIASLQEDGIPYGPVTIECERCTHALSGGELRCPKCLHVTSTGLATLVSLTVTVALIVLVLIP